MSEAVSLLCQHERQIRFALQLCLLHHCDPSRVLMELSTLVVQDQLGKKPVEGELEKR